MFENYDPNLESFDDPTQAFLSKDYREYISGVSKSWLSQTRDWSSFCTLTFRDDVSPEFAFRMLKGLIRSLNQEVFGNSYTRFVGHSYFSYVCGVEMQERGTPHFHLLIDRPVSFQRIWDFWYDRCGYVKTIKCNKTTEDYARIIKYVTKYVIKDGEMIIFLAKRRYFPKKHFDWWFEDAPKKIGNSSFGLIEN